ncbi:aldehyde dehydrogenase family protein [Ornithinimicrobium cryptoxanthini]|uniref:aldehyde dehydrogenase family protein n=1 Tax=Ornithinimicrobium cryptoxanthini TaxID=2934161 RepID=UPI002118B38E|nr:aldehyde dehydrogenase family protein [Ornithinimicrobium cryptoxanthini]
MHTSRTYTLTIGGEPVVGDLPELPVTNPATEAVIAHAPHASRDQLDAAVAAAREAYRTWSQRPASERRSVVEAIAQTLEDHTDDLASLLTQEQGKPLPNAKAEVSRSGMWARELARIAIDDGTLDDEVVVDNDTHRVVLRRVPLGVAGAIVPWNFPVSLAIWKIAPALLAGNTIIVKPSPNTPLTGLYLGELLREVVPAGVVNIITGDHDLGAWMTSHPGIDKIAFTGSTATGKKVMASAAENLSRVTLELGGNDPAIVCPDADIAATAQRLFWASFSNSGQYCLAAKRLYIHDKIFDEFAAEFAEHAKNARVGDGLDEGVQLGPVQNKAQYDIVQAFIRESRDRGDDILVEVPVEHDRGYFIGPVVVSRPPEDSSLVTEEPFGPIVPLLSYTDLDDVIARANASAYGLGASVWSSDPAKAREVAQRIGSGVVWINDVQMLMPDFPMGGHRESGIGRENGADGVLEYTNTQSLVERKTVTD